MFILSQINVLLLLEQQQIAPCECAVHKFLLYFFSDRALCDLLYRWEL